MAAANNPVRHSTNTVLGVLFPNPSKAPSCRYPGALLLRNHLVDSLRPSINVAGIIQTLRSKAIGIPCASSFAGEGAVAERGKTTRGYALTLSRVPLCV